jgi:anti-sigma factor RsiW
MTNSAPLSDKERADLVAYLDGELAGEAARALEAKLSLNPQVRAEAESLRRTWALLDYLPRPEPSPSFTNRTLSRVAPVEPGPTPAGAQARRRRRVALLGLGWAAGLLLAALAGRAAVHRLLPQQPGERELVRDLRLIENKRFYDLVGDLDFLRRLDDPDLFGEETPGW